MSLGMHPYLWLSGPADGMVLHNDWLNDIRNRKDVLTQTKLTVIIFRNMRIRNRSGCFRVFSQEAITGKTDFVSYEQL